MYMEGYFLVFPQIKKVEGPYSKEMASSFRYRDEMVVLAPPDYPQLADGLEIGAIYEEPFQSGGVSTGFLHGISSLDEFVTGVRSWLA